VWYRPILHTVIVSTQRMITSQRAELPPRIKGNLVTWTRLVLFITRMHSRIPLQAILFGKRPTTPEPADAPEQRSAEIRSPRIERGGGSPDSPPKWRMTLSPFPRESDHGKACGWVGWGRGVFSNRLAVATASLEPASSRMSPGRRISSPVGTTTSASPRPIATTTAPLLVWRSSLARLLPTLWLSGRRLTGVIIPTPGT